MIRNIYQKESIKKYMLSLVENKRDILDEQVGPNVDDALLVIAKNPGLSVHKCYEYLSLENKQKKNKTIGHMNVYIRIKKLENFGLIKKVVPVGNQEFKTDINGEIYYSVSTMGIFYIFMKNLVNTIDIDIILKNRNDDLFKNFLYPYIEIDTLEKLESKSILSAISEYLVSCAKIVDCVVVDHLIRAERNSGDIQEIGFVNSSLCHADNEDSCSFGPKFYLDYLRNRYDIPWLEENNIKVIDEVTKDKKIIRIFSNDKKEELVIDLYPETNKAILSDIKNNCEIAEFDIDEHPFGKNSYRMCDLIPVTLNEYIDYLFANELFYFYYDLESAINKLCLTVLQSICYDKYVSANKFRESQGDCNIFVKDKRFRKLANEARGKFDSYLYHELELYPLPPIS